MTIQLVDNVEILDHPAIAIDSTMAARTHGEIVQFAAVQLSHECILHLERAPVRWKRAVVDSRGGGVSETEEEG
jgi:hypothetical protein